MVCEYCKKEFVPLNKTRLRKYCSYTCSYTVKLQQVTARNKAISKKRAEARQHKQRMEIDLCPQNAKTSF